MALSEAFDLRTIWGAILFVGFLVMQTLLYAEFGGFYVSSMWIILIGLGLWLTYKHPTGFGVSQRSAKWWTILAVIAGILTVGIFTKFIPAPDEFAGVVWLGLLGLHKIVTEKEGGRYRIGVGAFWLLAAIALALFTALQTYILIYLAVVLGIPLILQGTATRARPWREVRTAELKPKRSRRK